MLTADIRAKYEHATATAVVPMRRHAYRWIGLLALVGLLGPALHVWGQEPEITVELPGGATMEMVWIEPGTFLMGSTQEEAERWGAAAFSEIPQHPVTISRGFYLGKYELTQEQWTSVMGTQPWLDTNLNDCPRCPATFITWNEFQDFISRLNEEIASSSFRLPTEAEWEYAARAGTTTTWPFGNEVSDGLDEYAWYKKNSCPPIGRCGYQEVSLRNPNPWGLYDMYGNVWEWVFDFWLRTYSAELEVDPIQKEIPLERTDLNIEVRIIKGGSHSNQPETVRPAIRNGEEPIFARADIGIRVLYQDTNETIILQKRWFDIKKNIRPLIR